jgi:hypothetical protein
MKAADLLMMGICISWISNEWLPRYLGLKSDFLGNMKSMYGRVLKEAKLDFVFLA